MIAGIVLTSGASLDYFPYFTLARKLVQRRVELIRILPEHQLRKPASGSAVRDGPVRCRERLDDLLEFYHREPSPALDRAPARSPTLSMCFTDG